MQFRKDTRHERTNSPTYYRWKAQFVITTPAENIKIMNRIAKELQCGSVSVSKDQARFSVQKINDIVEIIIPYFKKNMLSGNKKQDFILWSKGVEIIYKNKGKAGIKYKNKPRQPKWLQMAQAFSKFL